MEGDSVQLGARAIFTDRSSENITTLDETTWTSSPADIATVSDSGVVSALAYGEAQITVTYQGLEVTTRVFVEPSTLDVAITPQTITIAKGTEAQLYATGRLSDDSKRDLTDQMAWASSTLAAAIATDGMVTAGADVEGDQSVVISGSFNELATASVAVVDILDVELQTLTMVLGAEEINELEVRENGRVSIDVLGTFAREHTQILDGEVTFTISNSTPT
ncbi:MAG: Ig-like domain-containing protein, partial [Myxococcota bacterium]